MIKITLDSLLRQKNMTSKDLANKISLTEANLSILRSGKARAIRFETLNAICKVLNCQPGDILTYEENENE